MELRSIWGLLKQVGVGFFVMLAVVFGLPMSTTAVSQDTKATVCVVSAEAVEKALIDGEETFEVKLSPNSCMLVELTSKHILTLRAIYPASQVEHWSHDEKSERCELISYSASGIMIVEPCDAPRGKPVSVDSLTYSGPE